MRRRRLSVERAREILLAEIKTPIAERLATHDPVAELRRACQISYNFYQSARTDREPQFTKLGDLLYLDALRVYVASQVPGRPSLIGPLDNLIEELVVLCQGGKPSRRLRPVKRPGPRPPSLPKRERDGKIAAAVRRKIEAKTGPKKPRKHNAAKEVAEFLRSNVPGRERANPENVLRLYEELSNRKANPYHNGHVAYDLAIFRTEGKDPDQAATELLDELASS